MVEPSLIVTLLAQRSIEELTGLRDKTRNTVKRLEFELVQIEEAIETKEPQSRRRPSRRGDTRKRVIDFIAASADPVGPADVRDGLNATGEQVGSGAIYNQMGRLVKEGVLLKVSEGLYKLAPEGHASNGTSGETKIEIPEPLSRVMESQEGRND